jgi:hypothetical protein
MQMSRQELDSYLAALSRLNGNKPGRKDSSPRQSFKSLRKKRKKGKSRNGR